MACVAKHAKTKGTGGRLPQENFVIYSLIV